MADTRKMSITEALRELKLYDSRIMKAINGSRFVAAAKKSSPMIGNGSVARVDFVKAALADYQSIIDLISNRDKIKAAIVQSNATTNVEIGGKTYTVAQAIERKTSIEYERELLNMMGNQYESAHNIVESKNEQVDEKINLLLQNLVGKDSAKKITEADISAVADPVRQRDEYELVDPLGLAEKVRVLNDKIEAFESEVDVKLSISNAITFIEV